MNWISGEQGASKLVELSSLFHQRKLIDANATNNLLLTAYEPWMGGLVKVWNTDLMLDSRKQDIFYFDKDYVEKFGKFFEKAGIPILHVEGEKVIVRIFPDFCDIYPNGLNQLREGWEFLLNSIPWMQVVANAIIKQILPVKGILADSNTSVSSHLLPGTIFMSIGDPKSSYPKYDMAIAFAHELGHQALIVYQNADPILAEAFDTPVYSGVRKTYRPAIMAFHAAVALGYMIEATRALAILPEKEVPRKYLDNLSSQMAEQLKASLLDLERVKSSALGGKIKSELKQLL